MKIKLRDYCKACDQELSRRETPSGYCARHQKTIEGSLLGVIRGYRRRSCALLSWRESGHPFPEEGDKKPYLQLSVDGGLPAYLDVHSVLLLQAALSEWLLKAAAKEKDESSQVTRPRN